MSTSLIKPPGQGELLPEAAAPSFSAGLESKGEFTAERFFERRPFDYKRAVAMLAQGYGVLKTSQEIGNMSKNTVRAIRRREGETIDLLRGSLGSRSYDVAEDMLEAAQVLLEEVLADPKRRKKLSVADVQRLLVSVGIAVEKAQLLTGGATNRVMVETAEPQHNDYNAYIQSLKTAAPMGLAGKSLDQKESAQVLEIHAAAPETALAPAAEAVQAPGLGSSDTQSEGQHTQPTATQ